MIDVIIPIYSGFKEIQACLESVLNDPEKIPFEIVLVDDAAPYREISAYVRTLAEEYGKVTLLKNEINLGFVASVNRGMMLHPDRDVILLNSDTRVANDWVKRLHDAAYREPDIGTVTPFSNNATICSFPNFCQNNDLYDGRSPEELDEIFSEVNAGRFIDIPTAVGFCMYIRRQCLEETGLFDVESFGRGYGEENDFCMRASKKGWRHILCGDAFVFHEGNVSFGDEQTDRINRAMETLKRKYPDYHEKVHEHIGQDPARPLRIRAMLECIRRSPRQKIVFVNHNRGGGTEKHIQELSRQLGSEIDGILIKPEVNGSVSLNLGTRIRNESLFFHLPEAYSEILRICAHLKVSGVHFHHTMGLHPCLWGLAKDLDVALDVTLHDYYFINANPTLTDEKGAFCPDPEKRDSCCARAYPIPGNVTSDRWRENQKVLLSAARRVFAPSRYAASLFQSYFPEIKVDVADHPDFENDAPYPSPRIPEHLLTRPFRILVIGAVSREKGADILESCAKSCSVRGYDIQFHLIGYAYRPLAPCIAQYGAYHDDDLDRLIAENAPHLIWFPALWPETYSYTLSAALRRGAPIVAPDFGAFPERLADRPLTWIEPWDRDGEEWAEYFSELKDKIIQIARNGSRTVWENQPEPAEKAFRYSRDYLKPAAARSHSFEPIDFDWIVHRVDKSSGGNLARLSTRENILLSLLKIRNKRGVRTLLDFVPYRLQKAVKRSLSSRPIHEYLLHMKQK